MSRHLADNHGPETRPSRRRKLRPRSEGRPATAALAAEYNTVPNPRMARC
jgi:hypothetical protein